MQRIHKTLGICLLLTAVVFGVLKFMGGVEFGATSNDEVAGKSRSLVTRQDRGERSENLSTKKQRMRARKLTPAEANEFLKTTIIPKIEFDDITLEDALRIVNQEIAKQTPKDQPRVRILMDPNYRDSLEQYRDISIDGLPGRAMNSKVLFNFRESQISLSSLLKYISFRGRLRYWFYRGDYYLSASNDGGIGYFEHGEKLSRIQLGNIDASQLATKLNEIIDQHDYFGPKSRINISMSEKARAALLNGEVQLPRINLDLQNVTINEAKLKIAEHTGGALIFSGGSALFDPFHERKEFSIDDDPFALADDRVPFNITLDENVFKRKLEDDSIK